MEARRDTVAAARGWGVELLDDQLRLLVTEAVTNAVRHAGGDVDVRLCWERPDLRVSVHDAAIGHPQMERRPPGEGGLGLFLIDRIAKDWGVDATPETGKIVWFVLEEPHSDQ